MKTIEDLRGVAKSNFCDRCFTEYKIIIEPSIKELLLNPLADWRIVESNITRMVMIIEKVTNSNNEILTLDEGSYVFRWDEISGTDKTSGRDNWRLIKFLNQNYNIDWVKTATFKRDKGIIILSTEKNSLSLRLNDENKVRLKIDGVTTDDFIVRKVNHNKKKIYKIYKDYIEGSKSVLGVEVDVRAFQENKRSDLTDKIEKLYCEGILDDFSHRVLYEANEVRNKIHDINDVAPFSEQDIDLFYKARAITDKIFMATRNDLRETVSAELKSDAKKIAEKCLLELKL